LLCDRADNDFGGRLPVHVRCLLDEFPNIGLIPNFEKLIATMRSREISASIILQAQSQLKAIYKDNMDTIIGNCDTTLFLGGKERTTLKEISDILGKETIHLLNTGESRGQSASYSMNYQSLGKEPMSQDEISVMDGGKCILQVRGVRPFLSIKYDIEKHPNYKYLADYNPKLSFNVVEFINVFKENKAKLLEDMNKRNTKHVRIEINEDDVAETEKVLPQQNISPPVPAVQSALVKQTDTTAEPTEIIEAEPIEILINQNDISADNYEGDDTDDFNPDDTELV
jgi:type IV secretory pathway TraG/TraD family ATPase VirD4